MPLQRCSWVSDDPQYIDYHDHEWGVPQKDPQALFALLCLEGQQAGLSWITVLKKREAYYRLFYDFSPSKMAAIGPEEVEALLSNPAIIRHRGKINALITNAQAWLTLTENGESFSEFVWQFTDHPSVITERPLNQPPLTFSPASVQMSRALKKRGFKFVGPTICYAFMQASGMVIDHQADCFCHPHNQNHTTHG